MEVLLFNSFNLWSISPLDLKEGIPKCHFHSHDLSGINGLISSRIVKKKELFLIPGSKDIPYLILLNNLGFKPCKNASNYLLGLILALKKQDYKKVIGKYIIGVDEFTSFCISPSKHKLFLTVDFISPSLKRLTLTYEESIYDENFLILAEKR